MAHRTVGFTHSGVVRLLAVVGLIGGILTFMVPLAPPAGAVITPPGACTGSGTFQKGTKARGPFTEESSKLKPSTVVEVPKADVVHWKGSVNGPSGRRAIKGYVALQLPKPFGHVAIDSWGKTTVRTSNEGEHAYHLPKLVPRGVVFPVYGQHSENGTLFCKGYVKVKIEGSAFDTPWPIASLVVTFGLLVALILAGRPVFKKLWAASDSTL
jgi:hypothetical protein